MKLKLEKLLTAGFAAALGATFIAANPAEASIFYDLKNKTMTLFNDGKSMRYWTDGSRTSYAENSDPFLAYPVPSGVEQGVNSSGYKWASASMSNEERHQGYKVHTHYLNNGNSLNLRFTTHSLKGDNQSGSLKSPD